MVFRPGGCTVVYWTMGCAAYMGGSVDGKSSKTGLNLGKCPSKTGFNMKKYFAIYIYQSHISLIFGSKKRKKSFYNDFNTSFTEIMTFATLKCSSIGTIELG